MARRVRGHRPRPGRLPARRDRGLRNHPAELRHEATAVEGGPRWRLRRVTADQRCSIPRPPEAPSHCRAPRANRTPPTSNATTRLEDDLAALGLADAFDAVVNTSRIGFAKPDRRVFETAARSVGVASDRCPFVDDTLGHVEVARAAGLIGHHDAGVDALRGATEAKATRDTAYTAIPHPLMEPISPPYEAIDRGRVLTRSAHYLG
ncbi:HAD-IA family hydrolase [Streptomyces sp. NPDC046371]|uniref:HAD family hydrolase n=1 Tax=Streptomyces sp. NPDC046371 TaxID=3154916 RepID=UPI00340AF1EB